ncbi:MAG: LLM class flavin-dependent oxidoreductase, partial [Actinomycetota bacterium]|nr:LLM class flavin-dependent oxidoreductase [Actinomycetota bacterium]
MDNRYGITVPFDSPLHQQADLYKEFEDLGYTDLWSSEADGTDGFTPLVLASQWAPSMRLGIAIIPAYTRGPALMAQNVAS